MKKVLSIISHATLFQKITLIVITFGIGISAFVAVGMKNELEKNQEIVQDCETIVDAFNAMVDNGYDGSLTDFISSLNTDDNYKAAQENGFTGTKKEWAEKIVEAVNNNISITNAEVIKGDLYLCLSDGTQINAGRVQGAKGDKGDTGDPGISGSGGGSSYTGNVSTTPEIISIEINTEGNLIFTVKDSKGETTTYDVGKTKGDDGRGVTQVSFHDNAFYIKYTDSTNEENIGSFDTFKITTVNFEDGTLVTTISDTSTDEEIPTAKAVYDLVSVAGYDISIEDEGNYKYLFKLKDKDGTLIGNGIELDLPIESMVVSAEYNPEGDDGKGTLDLTLQSGDVVGVPVSGIVAGLVNNETTVAGQSLSSDVTAEAIADALKEVSVTFKNKTISGTDNTITNISISSLADPGIEKAGKVLKVNDAGKFELLDGGTSLAASDGIKIEDNTIKHTNSITANTDGVGSAVKMPVIKYDANGHITSVTTVDVYPPTTAGAAGQYWVSDGDGEGTWTDLATSITSDGTNAVTSKAIYDELEKKLNNSGYDKNTDVGKMVTVNSSGVLEPSDYSYKLIADKNNISDYITAYSDRCNIVNDDSIIYIRNGILYIRVDFKFTTNKTTYNGNTEWLNLLTFNTKMLDYIEVGDMVTGLFTDIDLDGSYGGAVRLIFSDESVAGIAGIWPFKQINISGKTSHPFRLTLSVPVKK